MAKEAKLKVFSIFSLVFFIIIHLVLISRLSFLPFPELLIYPYLTNIGLAPYSQIIDQHFPGAMFLPANLGKLGINTPQAIFSLHLLLIAIVHLLIFCIAYKKTNSTKIALLANFFYLLWQPFWEGDMFWIDSLMPLFLLPAFYYFDENNNKNLIKSGFLLGFALVFKQVIAPLVILLSLYLIAKKSKYLLHFWSAFVILPILMVLYLIRIGVFVDFFYWTVTFNLTTFAEFGRKYATFGELFKFLIVFLPSLLFIVAKTVLNKKVFSIFIFATLFYAYARFDLLHFQPVLPFLCIGLGIFFAKYSEKAGKGALIIYVLIASYFLAPYHNALSNGGYRFFGSTEKELTQKVKQYVEVGDPIFAFATTPHLYYLTHTRPSGNVFVFPFPWFSMKAEDKILSGLEFEPPKVIARDKTATTGEENLVEYMPKIEKFIEDNYQVVDNVDQIEILISKN